MHLMLRVVDIQVWIGGTNEQPLGISFVELPATWETMNPDERTTWTDEQVASHVQAGHSAASEIVDVEEPQYAYELAHSG